MMHVAYNHAATPQERRALGEERAHQDEAVCHNQVVCKAARLRRDLKRVTSARKRLCKRSTHGHMSDDTRADTRTER